MNYVYVEIANTCLIENHVPCCTVTLGMQCMRHPLPAYLALHKHSSFSAHDDSSEVPVVCHPATFASKPSLASHRLLHRWQPYCRDAESACRDSPSHNFDPKACLLQQGPSKTIHSLLMVYTWSLPRRSCFRQSLLTIFLLPPPPPPPPPPPTHTSH